MTYDLAQPNYNHAPQLWGRPTNSMPYQQLAVVEGAPVERCTLVALSGSHIAAAMRTQGSPE
jgi:hypothetical protein